MTARSQAIQDIKESLSEEGRCFLSFRKELNPTMRELIKVYTKLQAKKSHGNQV